MKYKHYPVKQAIADFKNGQSKRFKVTTINWTYGTVKGKHDKSIVHRNEYSWTLRNLIKFIRETEGPVSSVAEDIIDIQPEETRGRKS
jgi:hypothetical protein